ncbi:protein enabled homolog [Eucalyptus grandis]|uniref:protein enabled homolog n=1 Tax=Eucalyptus grandis TaxID=71139 RepID=UPI00192EEAF1|nr:protein enabled homolog [Eucalyptus grandis]
MDFELRRAREKLEKEQKERKAQAKARLERERKAKGEARKQREAIEAVQRSRRLDALEAQEKVEHQASVCPLRLIACRFCRDMVHAGDTVVDLRDKMQGRLHPDHW